VAGWIAGLPKALVPWADQGCEEDRFVPWAHWWSEEERQDVRHTAPAAGSLGDASCARREFVFSLEADGPQ